MTARCLGLIAIVVIAAACQPVATSPPPPNPDVASPVEGIVVSVNSEGLADVRGFTLRSSGGFAFTFALGTLENATEFPPSHISEHQATSAPVRVWFRVEGGERVVYRLEDAGAPSTT